MAERTQFIIGAEVNCTDGHCGEVIRVVVDPAAEIVTHLVVEPTHREGLGRLVPLELVDLDAVGGATGDVTLRCSLEEFDNLEAAEESYFLPGGNVGNITPPIITDTLPEGEIGIRKGQQVHATDGGIGRVQGLVIDRATHHVTHVLLHEGHLWGKKEVAIPIGAVKGIAEGIQLTLTKHEVQDLPAVDLDDPSGLA
jgi:sporulation protein YlmC with PRC-barrel domain